MNAIPLPRTLVLFAATVCGALIAAHFLRGGFYPLVVLGLAFPWLLLAGRPWADRTVQLLLLLSAAEWLRTLVVIALQRFADGQPWMRMAVILGSVMLFTLGSAVAIRVKSDSGLTSTRSSP